LAEVLPSVKVDLAFTSCFTSGESREAAPSMYWVLWKPLIPAGGILASIGAGFGVGSAFYRLPCLPSGGTVCCLGSGLLGLAAVLSPCPREGLSLRRIILFGLALYVLVLVGAEPFFNVYNAPTVLWSVALLSPLVAGGVILPSRGRWVDGVGCWVVLFAALEVLGYNVTHIHSGVGFFGSWAG
jgi:hypothetical protein